MNTLLFDIDGTLIRTKGAGFSAMRLALNEMFGKDEIPDVKVHGRTDRGIIEEIFQSIDISLEHIDDFSERYWQHLPETLKQTEGWVLPGVTKLLDRLSKIPDVALGILTGNAENAAEIKLKHFELDQYFLFGGYGDDHACRNEVAKLALTSAQQHLGGDFTPERLWVIGDTVNDIRCARAIQSRVVVVETGGDRPDELRQAEPDAQLVDLENIESFLGLLDTGEAA